MNRRLLTAGTCRLYHASVLPSILSPSSPEFVAKSKDMDALVADFEGKLSQVRIGGGVKAAERMKSKGKKLPRERSVPSCTFMARCMST